MCPISVQITCLSHLLFYWSYEGKNEHLFFELSPGLKYLFCSVGPMRHLRTPVWVRRCWYRLFHILSWGSSRDFSWSTTIAQQLLLSKIMVHFHVVRPDAILAPTQMLHLRSTLLGDISPSIPSTPVQATTWYTLSNVVPATRFTSERQDDAWEIDSESIYVQHDKATPIFL